MNASPLRPTTLAELSVAVCSAPRILAIGARTKPRLSTVGSDVTLISTLGLSGITEYQPDEFTFTALAGTPLRDIASTLGARGQYLPFDPYLLEAGATLGGTLAAGLSGPGRFRFGGLRHFILGVRLVDGTGRLMRLGGKVVIYAAGFDVPIFFVGSLGRFGVFGELTFKVFPRPAATLTLRLPVTDANAATQILTAAAGARWEIDALDYLPAADAVALRLAGPASALPLLAAEILTRFPGEILNEAAADALWTELRELHWTFAHGPLLKLALTPVQLPALAATVRTHKGRLHVTAGGNAALVSLPTPIASLGLAALTLRGPGPLWLDPPATPAIAAAVKTALDPQNRFPSIAP